MSNFLEIVNDVLRRTGQETVSTLVNAESPVKQAMDFVNDIYLDILETAGARYLETKTSFNTVSGTALYSLSSDADISFLIKNNVRETSSDYYLNEITVRDILPGQLTTSGKPCKYWIEGSQIRLFPIPNATYTIEYVYLKRPAKLINATDNSLIPLGWERLLIRGAQSLMEKFLGEVDSSRSSYSLYLEGLALLKSKTRFKPYSCMKSFYQSYPNHN